MDELRLCTGTVHRDMQRIHIFDLERPYNPVERLHQEVFSEYATAWRDKNIILICSAESKDPMTEILRHFFIYSQALRVSRKLHACNITV